jgi:uncharacterized protein (DUF58 family)
VKKAGSVALAGAALILIAYTFDASLLFVPGVAFVAIGLLTPPWVRLSLTGADLERRVHSTRVVEDEPVGATITVRRGRLAPPGAEVLDPFGAAPIELAGLLTPITGKREATIQVVARFPRRGRAALSTPTLSARDPLGLFSAVKPGRQSAQELLVLPRVEPLAWRTSDYSALPETSPGELTAEALGASELDRLVPYQPGTPASRIHWAALARGRGLMERRMRADSDSRPLVVIDARCPGASEELDAGVRAAASIVLELARRGGCWLLLPGERRPLEITPDLAGWPAAHARLAVVEGGPYVRPPALSDAARLGRLFYIATRPLTSLPPGVAASRRLAPILVLPDALSSPVRAYVCFHVAGCRAYVIAAPRTGHGHDRRQEREPDGDGRHNGRRGERRAAQPETAA